MARALDGLFQKLAVDRRFEVIQVSQFKLSNVRRVSLSLIFRALTT